MDGAVGKSRAGMLGSVPEEFSLPRHTAPASAWTHVQHHASTSPVLQSCQHLRQRRLKVCHRHRLRRRARHHDEIHARGDVRPLSLAGLSHPPPQAISLDCPTELPAHRQSDPGLDSSIAPGVNHHGIDGDSAPSALHGAMRRLRQSSEPLRHVPILDGNPPTALGNTALQHQATPRGPHAHPKPMGFLPLSDSRLIRSSHFAVFLPKFRPLPL